MTRIQFLVETQLQVSWMAKLRFRKQIKAGGARLNLSTGMPSLSIPVGPVTINISRRGINLTVTPIAGISLQQKIKT